MVFSFFKKQPEKMITRPAAVPKQVEGRENVPVSGQESGATKTVQEAVQKTDRGAAKEPAVAVQSTPSDFSDFAFSQSAFNFQVEAEVDPIDAQAEETAVFFANHQDQAAQAVLENAVRVHRSGAAERLWLMLFDLYRLLGQSPAFEALGIEYARAFEKSPPVWRGELADTGKARAGNAGSVLFKGNLTGDNAAAFDAVRLALEKSPKLRLDLSRVKAADPEGCGCLMKLLAHAKKKKQEVELLGREEMAGLLQAHIATGRAEGKECWLLILELFQQQGRQDAFEELAIDYAVTFEESPPSWEKGRVAAPEPVARVLAPNDPVGDAYVLCGEIKSSRFGDLPAYAQTQSLLLIDCAKLVRMDFISAGALLNALTSVRSAGKQIVFRHPNHLVAELFRVVGLTAVATILFAKN